MDQDSAAAHSAVLRTRDRPEWIACGLVFAVYTVTLWVARDSSFAEALLAGFVNTIPVVVLGAIARHIILTHLAGKSMWVQAIGHALLGAAFALSCYWILEVLLGVMTGTSATNFDVRPFPNRAMAWQLFENIAIYAALACFTYARRASLQPSTVLLSQSPAGEAESSLLARYFIRSQDDIVPVDVARIVSIAGADDYAEVITLDGSHLVRTTLAELEKALDPAKFIRVHRSRIVNVDHISRAEPAGGGRILLHMETGEAIAASRTGSRLLRERVL